MRLFKNLFKRRPPPLLTAKCGHETKLEGPVQAFGESRVMSMPRNTEGSTDYCLDCIGKMTILCAWCAKPIFIADPITLYTPGTTSEMLFAAFGQEQFEFVKDEVLGFKRPQHAVVYKQKPLQLVGCLRMNCAESGADRAGFWMPGQDSKGKVERVLTPFEMIIVGGEWDDHVVIDDLHNPNEAQPHKEDSPDIPISRTIA